MIVADFFRAFVYVLVLRLATGDAAGCDTPARSSAEIAATKKLLQRCGVRAETFERLQTELDYRGNLLGDLCSRRSRRT